MRTSPRSFRVRSGLVLAFLAGCVFIALPAFAGKVYVPLAVDGNVHALSFRTDAWIANATGQAVEFSSHFIAVNQDGTERPDESGKGTRVLPGGSFKISGLAENDSLGVLEIDLPEGAVASARLVAVHPLFGESLGTDVPLVSGDNLFLGGETAHVQGWEREEGIVMTDFGVLNLTGEPNECQVSVFRANGNQIQSTALLPLKPLSNVHFGDALGILQEKNLGFARAEVTCSESFYPYSTLVNLETGEVSFLTPSASGDAGLLDPGADCPPGAYCLRRNGTVFVPSRSSPVGAVDLTVPQGTYSRVDMTFDVTLGGWYPQNPDGRHNVFWLVRNNNRDMFGFLNVSGPGSDTILLRHGFGQRHTAKAKLQRGLRLTPGQTYQFQYVYDTAQRVVHVIVRNPNGDEILRMTGAPDIGSIGIGPGDDVILTFGFKEHINPQEVPTYGWAYRNLEVIFTP